MANPYFQFKKFTVWHDQCAMKVGTDGVLLGAWADPSGAARILDVGTGTGLVALMLAQRSEARIDAIDIDASACGQAEDNISRSPFADRIGVTPFSLAAYRQTGPAPYDLIVSNPPYFTDSLKCPDTKRTWARHTDTLPLPDLLRDSRALLTPQGRLALILPYDRRDYLLACGREVSLFVSRETAVLPTPGSCPKRLLVELSQVPAAFPFSSQLTIELERHRYTLEFSELVRAFYLHL